MKDWITVGLLTLNAVLLFLLLAVISLVGVGVWFVVTQYGPTVTQATDDFHAVRTTAEQKVTPVIDGLNAVAKSVSEFKPWKAAEDAKARR